MKNGGGGVGGSPPTKLENCKLMCTRLCTLSIGWYAPEHDQLIPGDGTAML